MTLETGCSGNFLPCVDQAGWSYITLPWHRGWLLLLYPVCVTSMWDFSHSIMNSFKQLAWIEHICGLQCDMCTDQIRITKISYSLISCYNECDGSLLFAHKICIRLLWAIMVPSGCMTLESYSFDLIMYVTCYANSLYSLYSSQALIISIFCPGWIFKKISTYERDHVVVVFFLQV